MNGIAPRSCLIVVENMFIGYQVSLLLKRQGWQTYVVYRDYEAYGLILRGEAHAVVADIDASNLGGLEILAYCHRHYPLIETYAIIQSDHSESKRLAHEVAGCLGYFYQVDEHIQADNDRGILPDWAAGFATN